MGNTKKREGHYNKKSNFSKSVKNDKFTIKQKIICVFTFIVCLTLGLGTFFGIRNINANKLNVNFKCTLVNKDLGNVNSLNKSTTNYGYCVFYPTFNVSTLDNFVDKQNKSIINMFLKEYKSYKTDVDGKGAILFSDYEMIDYGEFYQILRKNEYRIHDEENIFTYSSVFYDVKNDKVLSLNDVFDSIFKDYISPKIINYLDENTDIYESELTKLRNNLSLNDFYIDIENNCIHFYISNELENYDVEFSIDSVIKSHMKINFESLEKLYFAKHNEDVTENETDENTSVEESTENSDLY